MTVQAVPSRCSMSDWALVPWFVWPTAQALVAEATATEPTAATVSRLMAGTMVQAVPFQCSVRTCFRPGCC